jgi:hypothetical protein
VAKDLFDGLQSWIISFISVMGCCTLCTWAVLGSADQDFRILRTRHPLLLESAYLGESGSTSVFWGVEFEEDSGDFPTTKFPLHTYWVVHPRVGIGGSAELVIFNQNQRTSSGLTNSAFTLFYQFNQPSESRPAFTFRQDILAPTGGFSTGKWNATFSMLMTWPRGNWLFHVNGAYTAGGHDDRPILVSEVDRARILGGVHYSPIGRRYAILISFSGAEPIRPKPFEPSVELGFRYRLGEMWVANLGVGRSLIDRAAPDYLIRVTLQHGF